MGSRASSPLWTTRPARRPSSTPHSFDCSPSVCRPSDCFPRMHPPFGCCPSMHQHFGFCFSMPRPTYQPPYSHPRARRLPWLRPGPASVYPILTRESLPRPRARDVLGAGFFESARSVGVWPGRRLRRRAGRLGTGRSTTLRSRLLVASGQPLLGRTQILVANHRQPREHIFHLLLGVGVVDLEIALIVENPGDPRADPLVAVVDPAGHLSLNHRRRY